MDRLVSLELGNNKIKYLTKGCFNGLTNLKNLNLFCNKIESIEPHTFDCFNQLKKIELARNKIGFKYIHELNIQLKLPISLTAERQYKLELKKLEKTNLQ